MSDSPGLHALVIFDCDGVLVDSETLVQEVDQRLLAELGWPITVEEIVDQHLGRSEAAVLASIARRTGPVPEDFPARRRALFEQVFRDRLEPVKGVVQVLDVLDSWGVVCCVASSGTPARMVVTLGKTGLLARFEGRIHSAVDVEHGKPAPDLFLYAASQMGAPADRCLVVEDSPAGVAAARAAGMAVVGYAALTPAPMLADADHVITDMSELLALIEAHLAAITARGQS